MRLQTQSVRTGLMPRLFLRLGVLEFGLPRQRCFTGVSSLQSDLDSAALHGDGHGVGAMVRLKLGEKSPHMSFDGFLGNIELLSDDLVALPEATCCKTSTSRSVNSSSV